MPCVPFSFRPFYLHPFSHLYITKVLYYMLVQKSILNPPQGSGTLSNSTPLLPYLCAHCHILQTLLNPYSLPESICPICGEICLCAPPGTSDAPLTLLRTPLYTEVAEGPPPSPRVVMVPLNRRREPTRVTTYLQYYRRS